MIYRIRRALHYTLCALLVLGLFPGTGELVETVAHLIHDGHLPHSEAHEEVAISEGCDDGDEHGCSALAHHCHCCVTPAALPPDLELPEFRVVHAEPTAYGRWEDRGPPRSGITPPYRPPIA